MAATAPLLKSCSLVTAQELAAEILKNLKPWEKTATKVDFIFLRLEFRLLENAYPEFDPFDIDTNRQNERALYLTKDRSNERNYSIERFKERISVHQQVLDSLIPSSKNEIASLRKFHAGNYEVLLYQEDKQIAHLAYRFDTSSKKLN